MSENTRHGGTFVAFVLQALSNMGNRDVFVHEGRRITGNEARALVFRLARALRRRGLGRGDGFAVLSGNLPEAYLLQLAGQLIGARYTGPHPSGSFDDQAFVLADAEIHTLVYDPRTYSDRAGRLADACGLKQVFSIGPGSVGEDLLAAAAHESDEPVPADVDAEDVSVIAYTGGTTGRSKGACHTQQSWLYSALVAHGQWEWPHDLRLLVSTPITHAGGLMIAPALARGATVVLMDKFDPQAFLDTVETEKITATFLVPSMIYVLLEHPTLATADTSSLQMIVYGSAPMSPTRLATAIERFGRVFVQGYGQIEAGNGVLLLHKADHDIERPERLASAGRAPAGIEVTVRTDAGEETLPGEVGEICIAGPVVMKGYWRQPEQSAEALRDGWLHTGDMGIRDHDGYITLVDRRKDMIISGGFNVYPREVEDVLLSHPDVSGAAVIGVPDDKWGEAVRALVVLADGAQVTTDELMALVRERKGPINTPKVIEMLTELPLTPVGKLDKKALRQRYWASQERGIH